LQAPGPGLWSLSLASGAELLSARHGGATGARHGAAVPGSRYAAPSARALPVPLLSYTGATLDILVGADPNHGLSTRTTAAPALAAAPASAAAGTALDETVHIFSLASGLLYERFLRIMMKTAVERASRPLKFWILGNFLSPAFRHAVNSGALATAVGAQVIASLIRWRSCSTIGRLSASECARVRLIVDDCVPHQVAIVQYDWPSHLREQTEKQRLIWGYKILFLDVLFPQVKGDDCDGVRRISDESPMDLRRISLGCLVLTLPSSQSLRKIIFVEELIAS
jgi:hypothetical protein